MLVPKLRFVREDGKEYPEWNSKSFAKAFTPLNNNTFSRDMLSENGIVLNIHYGDILVKFGEICDIQTADIPKINVDIDTSKYDELQDGDIILADTAEDETVGKAIEIYNTGTLKVVSGLHTMACRPNDDYAAKYMGYYINSPTYHNQLLPFMQGIKVTSIGRKNIADTVIYYPTNLVEQQKIANFLSNVDEVIAQSEAEVTNLEQQKKAAMQKIFSQEVRFKREDGKEYPDWKSDVVGNRIELFDEKVTSDCDLPILTSSKNNGIEFQSDHFGREQNHDIDGYNILPRGYATYRNRSDNRDFTFNINEVCDKGIISKFYPVFSGKNCNLFFLVLLMNNSPAIVKEIGFTAIGTGQKVLSISDLKKIKIRIPCLEEQQKIADFLYAYDEAISYAKQELEKWKELKKGLMQQMFV